jgi:endoglucanase Acf2
MFSGSTNPQLISDCSCTTYVGTAECVQGNVWSLSATLPSFDFSPPSDVTTCDLKARIQYNITNVDLYYDDGYEPGTSVYDYSKRIYELARLAVISDHLGMTDERDIFVQRLWERLVVLLDSSYYWYESTDGVSVCWLGYETSWGGILNNFADDYSTDYGNGIYNDHHLQVRVCAIK